jgi:hypothetical protein
LPTVNVSNQAGTAVDGATVQVYAPPTLFGLGGYNATATTDSDGNATFPQATIFSLPSGSSADVIVNYTDPTTGIAYAAEGNWGVGLSGFTPDPLDIQLIENLSIATEGTGGFSYADVVDALEIILIVGVAAGIGIVIYTVAKDIGAFDKTKWPKTSP